LARAVHRARYRPFVGLAPFIELKLRLEKIHDLDRAQALLEWDQWTMMPPRGAAARIEQVASLERARHERFGSDEIGRLLEQVRPYEASLPPESDDAALIRVARRDYKKAVRVPAGLQAQITRAAALSEHAWREARERSDFKLLLPRLEEIVELKRRYIDCFDVAHPYDALLDDFEPGMTTAEIERILGELKSQLIPLVSEVAARDGSVDDSCLRGHFPRDRQEALVREILRELPLDAGCWRLDTTTHPFADAMSTTDVRLTTRYSESDLAMSIFTVLHEFGHGLYEAGVDPALERTPLCRPASLGVHESQSRMWENMLGRSLPFWRRFYPRVQAAFSEHLAGRDVDEFHRAVNKVRRSLIRTEADELTYDLHIIIRFELEQEILLGRLALRDLPEAWNERVVSYIGVAVPSDADGVLQDVHWAEGAFGYFPTYSLGNVIAGQLWQALRGALPDLDEQVESGELAPLREWLRENVHRHGHKFTAPEIVERVTGGPIEVGPYISYLNAKFEQIYSLA
jgi:carboxypeptidase Taq